MIKRLRTTIPEIKGVMSHNGIFIRLIMKTFNREAIMDRTVLSVYRYFLLKPPLATQNMNRADDKRKVDNIMMIYSMIILSHNYKLLLNSLLRNIIGEMKLGIMSLKDKTACIFFRRIMDDKYRLRDSFPANIAKPE